MKKITLLFIAFYIFSLSSNLFAQSGVSINNTGNLSDNSAMLDVESTSKGFLPPRMTAAERDAISNPADGLIIFNTTTNCLNFYAGGFWYETCGNPDVTTVYNSSTGETWMDRNLGASQVATSSTDPDAYGALYQWGRATEGHESRTSGQTTTIATTAVPNAGNPWDGLFIIDSNPDDDWLTPPDDNLWQGASGTNNPCPTGFRLPTKDEWDAERLSWSSNDANGAFDSPLKLVVAGYRLHNDGLLYGAGVAGLYWSSSFGDTYASCNLFFNSAVTMVYCGGGRADSNSVRCIKD